MKKIQISQDATQAAVAKLEAGQIEMKADLNHVKNQTAFKSNTTPSMAQKGFEAIGRLENPKEVFRPVEGTPSVLFQTEQDVLHELTKEKDVVEYLTRHFEQIFTEDNVVVVNSEKCGWIDTGGGKKNLQQPDLLICHKALYTTNPKIKDGTRRFGGLSHWILRDCIGAIMEAKLSFAGHLTSAMGQIVNYSGYIAHACNEKVVKGVLFDKHKLYFVRMNDGTLARSVECKWTDAGSKSFLRNWLQPPGSWMKLLDAACQQHSLAVEPGSFLGYGADGRVFKVSKQEPEPDGTLKEYAVKLVLKENFNHLTCESDKLQSAHAVCPNLVIRVVHPGQKFKNIGGFMVIELGTKVERDEYKRIIEALVNLHRFDIVHGDARVNNVVEVGGSIKWIDFREAEIVTDNSIDQQEQPNLKTIDMTTLMKSLLQINYETEDLRKLVAKYSGNVTDKQLLNNIIPDFKKIYDCMNETRVSNDGLNSNQGRDHDDETE
jgi:hypothetical protein